MHYPVDIVVHKIYYCIPLQHVFCFFFFPGVFWRRLTYASVTHWSLFLQICAVSYRLRSKHMTWNVLCYLRNYIIRVTYRKWQNKFFVAIHKLFCHSLIVAVGIKRLDVCASTCAIYYMHRPRADFTRPPSNPLSSGPNSFLRVCSCDRWPYDAVGIRFLDLNRRI